MDDPANESSAESQAMIRHRRRVAHARTPEEQARVSEALQAAAMEAIHGDPVALRAFVQRNHRKRTSDKVAALEAELMRERP